MDNQPRTRIQKSSRPRKAARPVEVEVRVDEVGVDAPVTAETPSLALWGELDLLAMNRPDLVDLVARVKSMSVTTSLADHSINAYGSKWGLFTEWCSSMGLSSLPASTATVVLYLAHRSTQNLKTGTLNSDLCAIRSYHLQAGYTNPVDHEVTSRLLQANTRLRASDGESVRKAHPLSLHDLRSMVACLEDVEFRVKPVVSDLFRMRLKAILLVAWFTGRRVDEMARAEMSWLKERDKTLVMDSNRQKRMASGFARAPMK